MNDKKKQQAERIQRYAHMIEQQTGKAVRPYRADGYVNMMNRYGTSKDTSEHYKFAPEPDIPDDSLTLLYEGNGLFAKVIDAPAEEAIKHGFTLKDVSDQEVESFYQEALDELDWEEVAMTGIKWARLFGGSIAVMLINDGGGLEEPLNWKRIKSIDDIRVYDRSVIQPDYSTMFKYDPRDPFGTRGSRLGMPEFYHVNSRFGSFVVHESRCLVFQNGVLPENCSNTNYQLWGMPEYIRIHRAIRDSELAHGTAPKMLDRSVQPVYKMKDLSMLLSTDEGEDQVLKRLQVIDLARSFLSSLVIDSENEDYDFKSFQFTGVADVIDATCNYLSALTNIPQTILFGRSPAGMNSTGESDLENWYSYVQRIQKRMLKSNLRYLLSVIFQAGLRTGEVDEVPKIKIEFNPLKTMSDSEQAELESKKAATALVKAQTAQIYRDMEVIDSTEIRRSLADSDEFDIDTILDEYESEEDLMAIYEQQEAENPGLIPGTEQTGEDVQSGKVAYTGKAGPGQLLSLEKLRQYNTGVDVETHETDPGTVGSAPANAPAATKLPQDMSEQEIDEITNQDEAPYGVGVLVIKDGRILCGSRHNDTGYGLICGPGGHGEKGETYEQSAIRETQEEFGITPKELIPVGVGPLEPESGLRAHIFLCTDFDGEVSCDDLEMVNPKFRTMEELEELKPSLFPPFADSLEILMGCLDPDDDPDDDPDNNDGGPGSGNFGHEGRPGKVGGSSSSGHVEAASVKSHLEDYQVKYLSSPSTAVTGGWGMKSTCKQYMRKEGASEETLNAIDRLFDGHKSGGDWQKDCDEKIAKHINDGDAIGQALIARSQFETGCYEEWKAAHPDSNQLNQNGELRVYRKGDRSNGVECWTIDPDGADMGHGGIGVDHETTLEQLQREGYSVIAGFGTMGGAPGEGEITFVKTGDGESPDKTETETESKSNEANPGKLSQSVLKDLEGEDGMVIYLKKGDEVFECPTDAPFIIDAMTGELLFKEEIDLGDYEIDEERSKNAANHILFEEACRDKITELDRLQKEIEEAYKRRKIPDDIDQKQIREQKLTEEIRKAAAEHFKTPDDCLTAGDAAMYVSSKGYFSSYGDERFEDNPDQNNVGTFKGMDAPLARDTATAIDDLFSSYPQLKGKLGGIKTDKDSEGDHDKLSETAEAHSSWFEGVRIRAKSKHFMDSDIAFDVSVGHCPPGVSGIKYLIEHEYCHEIEHYLQYNGEKNIPSRILDAVSKKLNMTTDECRVSVSEYAANPGKNHDAEFLAEAWAEYRCSKAPRDVAKAVGEEFEKYIRGVK